jgi:hypothetical protein
MEEKDPAQKAGSLHLILLLMKFLNILVFVVTLSCTSILNGKEKERELVVIEVPNRPYRLRIVHTPSNATIQSAIQVRKLYGNKEEDVLQGYERYNFLASYKLLSDTTLMIVVKDTISYLDSNRFDTMIVKIK